MLKGTFSLNWNPLTEGDIGFMHISLPKQLVKSFRPLATQGKKDDSADRSVKKMNRNTIPLFAVGLTRNIPGPNDLQ
jgi:hypothetical protein